KASQAHVGQHRVSGEDYVEHPLHVARILADLRLDAPTLAAALLHDTLEDTDLTIEHVAREFGPVAARLVEGATKSSGSEFRSDQQVDAENIRRMLLAMADDVRV